MNTPHPFRARPQATRLRLLARSSRSPPSRRSSRQANPSRSSSTCPGREGFETNEDLAAIYGNGGDVAPIVPVVTLAAGARPSTRRASATQLDAALAKVEAALPEARTASYASTGDRAFVSDDGRTTFALVYIPAKGGVAPGQEEADRRRPRSPASPSAAPRSR